jgi:hypothetical protein
MIFNHYREVVTPEKRQAGNAKRRFFEKMKLK